MGSEKDTGRTLVRTDWIFEVAIAWLKLAMVVLSKMEPLAVVFVAVVGTLLGVMGLLK